MWTIVVLRRLYAAPSVDLQNTVSVSFKVSSISSQLYWLLRLVKSSCRDLLLQATTAQRRVHPHNTLTILTSLRSLHPISENWHSIRLFSTLARGRDGGNNVISLQAVINQRIVSTCAQAEEDIRSTEDKTVALRALDRLQDLILLHQQDLNAVNVATVIHRIGRISELSEHNVWDTHRLLLNRLISILCSHCSELQSRHVSNVVWGLGKMALQLRGTSDVLDNLEEPLSDVMDRGMETIHGFQAQHISNLLIGLAYLQNRSHHRQIVMLLTRARQILDKFGSQELSNTVWALAKLEYVDLLGFLLDIFAAAERKIQEFSSLHISLLLWSLAAFQYWECERLVDGALNVLKHLQANSYDLAIVLWSCQQLRIRPSNDCIGELIRTCTDLYKPALTQRDARNQVMIFSVLSDFSYSSPYVTNLAEVIAGALSNKVPLLHPHDICISLWAFAVSGKPMLDSELLHIAFQHLSQSGLDHLRDEDIRQFYQCLLHCSMFRPDVDVKNILPDAIDTRWKTIWCVRQATSPLPLWVASALVTLEDMGYICKGRFLEQGLINTCLLDVGDGQKYAIEGISFFRSYRNEPGQPTARCLWKIRLLQTMGYEVILIEEEEWAALKQSPSKIAYLKQKITSARVNAARKLKAAERHQW